MIEDELLKRTIQMALANLKMEDDFPIIEEKQTDKEYIKTKQKIKQKEVYYERYMG